MIFTTHVYGIEASGRSWPGLGSIDQCVHPHLSSSFEPVCSRALLLSVVTHIISGGTHGMLTHGPVQDNENCGYDTHPSHHIPLTA